ncbi:hypothetical protein PM082_006491 [Marasmius tenuissimus]|nr:hypothetical protein PM082_006491 [Marasmius tenuissimus]
MSRTPARHQSGPGFCPTSRAHRPSVIEELTVRYSYGIGLDVPLPPQVTQLVRVARSSVQSSGFRATPR